MRHWLRQPTAVWLIFAACTLPELTLTGADLGLWADPRLRGTAIEWLGFWSGLLYDWQPNYAAQPWLMFLTYGFLHGGLAHWAVNMLTLLSLGRTVARPLGGWRFLSLYLALMVAGALGFAMVPNGSMAPMVGASGALFGLAGVILAWEYRYRRRRGRSLAPVIQNLVLLLAMNVAPWFALKGQLAWQTHLGGFLAGWVLAQWVRPDRA